MPSEMIVALAFMGVVTLTFLVCWWNIGRMSQHSARDRRWMKLRAAEAQS